MNGTLDLQLKEKKVIAEKTLEISLGISNKVFSFTAGQYLNLTLKKLDFKDKKGKSRDFSISSSPNNKKVVTMAFRLSKSAFKQTLLKLPLNSKVKIRGPKGTFILPQNKAKLFFIAGGIGITPLLCMVRYATEKKLKHSITLFYANRTPRSTAYLNELNNLAKRNPYLKIFFHYGVLTDEIIKSKISSKSLPLFYVCGPPAMVEATQEILARLKIPESKVKFEEFSGYQTKL